MEAEHSEILERMREGVRKIEEANAAAEDRFARYEGLSETLAGVEATKTSTDQSVSVTAGPNGSIRDIRFGPEAVRLSPSKLSEVVMSTLRQAVAEAAQQQAKSVADVVGDKYDLVERVMRAQEDPGGPQNNASAQSSSQSSADRWEDDDFDDEYDPFAWR